MPTTDDIIRAIGGWPIRIYDVAEFLDRAASYLGCSMQEVPIDREWTDEELTELGYSLEDA
ncbi:hypothetical protein M1N44_02405 [Dehalococcoidia bacterium]|nr:hypothetical protein [Dehalococcoidia bacterium]MCL0070610.1 hypothetical protein [Dehalococcoidia bacterium]MCL0092229.1 hypothetical protein [Dehalococcoidia bacterium]